MKNFLKPVPLVVSIFISLFWLLFTFFLSQIPSIEPVSFSNSISLWYGFHNLLTSCVVFFISYSLILMRVKALTKISHSRPMGTSEHLWYRMGQLSSNNFVMVAQVEGELEEESLKKALQCVIQAQPMLRSSAKKKGDLIRLVEYSSAIVQIKICERKTEDSWQEQAEEEMNSIIDVVDDPLWRFTWIKGAGKHELLMTFNHMIADGRSGLNFYEMLFESLSENSSKLPRLPFFQAYEKQMINTDNIFIFGVKFLKSLKEYFSSKKLKWNKIPETASGDPFSALISKKLPENLTAALVRKCRENNSTVSSFLAASMLTLLDGKENTALSLAADMRPYLNDLAGREIGYFVTSIDLMKEVGSSGDTWTLAKTLKTRVDTQLNTSQFLFDQLIRFLALKTAKTNEAFQKLIKKSLNNSLLLTNIGKVGMRTDYGKFKLKHCFHVPAVHLMKAPFFCLATSTVDDAMVLNFTYNAGCMLKVDAEDFAEKFMVNLQSL